jgi:micrococcal nuclease
MSTRQAATWIAVFAVLVLAAFGLLGDEGDERQSPTTTSQPTTEDSRSVQVLRIVDGDTILVRSQGSGSERVRYIGVDTPESVKEDTPVQCFGHEAAEFNRRLVDDKTVRLVPDREAEDRYGRTLAYVYVGDVFVNAELLRAGMARTIEVPPNTARAGQFRALQKAARSRGKGLWGACGR